MRAATTFENLKIPLHSVVIAVVRIYNQRFLLLSISFFTLIITYLTLYRAYIYPISQLFTQRLVQREKVLDNTNNVCLIKQKYMTLFGVSNITKKRKKESSPDLAIKGTFVKILILYVFNDRKKIFKIP